MKTNNQKYLKNSQYVTPANYLQGLICIPNSVQILRDGLNQIKLPDSAKVLELGAGHGALWMENKDRILPDWDVTISDFSKGMLSEVQEILKNNFYSYLFTCNIRI